jgi:hypothetical protein
MLQIRAIKSGHLNSRFFCSLIFPYALLFRGGSRGTALVPWAFSAVRQDDYDGSACSRTYLVFAAH